MPSTSLPSSTTPTTADVGRGAAWLTLANLWHGVTGFLIYVAASRLLPADDFGTLCVVMATALAIEVLLIQALPKGVARGLPILLEHLPPAAPAWIARMTRLSFAASFVLYALFFALAGPLASAMRAPELAPLLRLAGLDFIAFAGFVIFVAVFNGTHRYGRQAAVMAQYSTAKLVAVLGLLAWLRTPQAGIAGYVLGSFAGTAIALAWVRPDLARMRRGAADWMARGERDVASPAALFRRAGAVERLVVAGAGDLACEQAAFHRAVLRFVVPIGAFAVAVAIYLNLDLLLAKALFSDTDAGYYAGAAQVARMVYFVFLSFSEALFPAVSQAVARRDEALSATQIRRTVGLVALLLPPIVGLGIGLAAPTLALLFGAPYALAGGALQQMLIAALALVAFQVFAAPIAAQGHPWRLFAMVLVATGLMLGTAAALQGRGAFGFHAAEAMARLAALSAVFAVVAALAARLALMRTLRALAMPLPALLAGLAGFAAMATLPPMFADRVSSWWLIPYGALWFAAYLVVVSPGVRAALRQPKSVGDERRD